VKVGTYMTGGIDIDINNLSSKRFTLTKFKLGMPDMQI
jgi:hypothetical protein